MSKPTPPLGWLRTFECAGRHLSFTLAADELRMTQSAVSQQIRSLEARFGCPLFIRKHRSITLTDEGRRLLPDITQAIGQLSKATAMFDQSESSEMLTVATSVSVVQWYLVPQLTHFMQQHPHVDIRFITTVWPDEFAHANADVHIRFGPVSDHPGSEQSLGTNRLVLVASPHFIKTNRLKKLTNKNISQFSLIQVVGTADTWSKCARQFGLNVSCRAAINVDSHGLAVDFAQSGYGIALTSEMIAKPALADKTLQLLHPDSIPSIDGYFISVTANSTNPAAHTFVDWVIERESLTVDDK